MGVCVEKLPHTCGSKDGLQVFVEDNGEVNGYCFSCRTFVRHPYGEEKTAKDIPEPEVKSPEQIQAEIAEISGYPVVSIEGKRLRDNSLKHFGVHVGLSEFDGKTPEVIYYPYTKDGRLVGYKAKLMPLKEQGGKLVPDKDGKKKIWSVGDLKGVDLFGWEQALKQGARNLIITEGEDDAISWSRCLDLKSKPEFRELTAVVSLPAGAGTAKTFFTKNYKKIKENFGTIHLSFDMDKPGREAVEAICSIYTDVKSINLPSKDANQCILDGKMNAMYSALFKSEVPKNTRLVFGGDIHEEAKEPAKYGELTWPFAHINKDTRHIRYGETIYIGAGVKMGKSELVNQLAAHFMIEHNTKVFLAKPEEVNKKTYKLLAGKVAGKIFHDPDKEFDENAYEEAGEKIKDLVAMVNLYQHIGWTSLKDDILAAIAWGAKAIFIDPITNLTSGMDAATANTHLEAVAEELSVIAKDHNVVVFIFCHLKAPEGSISSDRRQKFYREGKFIGLGNCPHEGGGDVLSSQFAGSRAMMRKCNTMIGFEGNKDPELRPEIRNIRHLKILEDREFGVSGIYPIYWNHQTTLFKEC